MGALAPLVYSIMALLISVVLPSPILSTSGSTATLEPGSLSWYEIITAPRNLWMASHAVFAISMFGTIFIRSAFGTVLLFSFVGFSWAINSRIPYSLLGHELSRSYSYDMDNDGRKEEESYTTRQGLIHGIHNMAICLPQVIIMLAMGIVWLITGSDNESHSETAEIQTSLGIVWFLRLGGVFSLCAMYYTTKLRQWDYNHIGSTDRITSNYFLEDSSITT